MSPKIISCFCKYSRINATVFDGFRFDYSTNLARFGRVAFGLAVRRSEVLSPDGRKKVPMKITDIIVHPLAADPPHLAWTAHEPFGRAQLTLVEIRTDEGVVGIGECASGPQKVVCDMLEMIRPALLGLDPCGHVEIWQRMMSITTPRPGGLGGWDGLPTPLPRHLRYEFMAAMAGIDIALWDIKGKAANLPVFRLLGGTSTEVETYAVGGMYLPNGSMFSCVDELAGFIELGYRAVKLKSGAYSLQDEVARIRAVREAIGPDVLLMLDVNAAYDVEGAIAYSHAVEPYDIHWFEEPLHWYLQPADFLRLARASNIPLSHCEREWHRFTTRDFIDSGAIRFVQFDSTRFGGFTEGLRVAAYAEQKNVLVQPHSWPHLHAHIVSAFGNACFGTECVGDPRMHPIHHHIFAGGAAYRDGKVHLTEAPGFGMEIDWDAVKALKA
jgi:L-alanine-DL-glutamate epimerase-like enolase superfamily enzyme